MIDTVTAHRLTALNSLNILDTASKPAYDAITRLACYVCDSLISLISFLTEKKQFLKSYHGLNINHSLVEYSFCSRAILQPNDIFIIEDPRTYPEFKNNPRVTGYPNSVFYAGIPFHNNAGIPVGTLSVIDPEINSLTGTEVARQVMELLNAREERNKTENPISVRPIDILGKRLDRQIREKEAVIVTDDLPIVNTQYTPLLMGFQNLISKAIKYSNEETKPEVKITCKKSKKNDYYPFIVEDIGKDIPQHQKRVFIMFVSLDDNSEIPGSGMGLATVKKIIEKQNGSIKLIPKPEKGTKLTFTLPISKTKK